MKKTVQTSIIPAEKGMHLFKPKTCTCAQIETWIMAIKELQQYPELFARFVDNGKFVLKCHHCGTQYDYIYTKMPQYCGKCDIGLLLPLKKSEIKPK